MNKSDFLLIPLFVFKIFIDCLHLKVCSADSRHTCTSFMLKDVFLSLIVNKTRSAEKTEGRPIDK